MNKKSQTDKQVIKETITENSPQPIQINEGNTGFLTIKLLQEILIELRKYTDKKR